MLVVLTPLCSAFACQRSKKARHVPFSQAINEADPAGTAPLSAMQQRKQEALDTNVDKAASFMSSLGLKAAAQHDIMAKAKLARGPSWFSQ